MWHVLGAITSCSWFSKLKAKVIPQQAEVAQGVPARLRPRIFLTFGTTRVVGRQPYTPAAFTPGEISDTHFQELSRPQSTWLRRGEPWKKSPVTPPGIDPGTFRLVAQCLNHHAVHDLVLLLNTGINHLSNIPFGVQCWQNDTVLVYSTHQSNGS